ncbi:MAG: ATP-binding protein [Bacteroidales bacterium]|nr:ATP-binding protein [Bacteroidales bacterium]
MNKDTIKVLIAEYQQRVLDVSFVDRPYVMEENLNYVFVGLRRVGKSYLMFQHIHHLINAGHVREEILYFNFEDDRIASLQTEDLDLIKVCYEEMFDHKPIFFLDEIQIVPQWERFARRLADQGYRVYITGSNAKMLSSEIATTLGGRFVIRQVYPFSFGEYLTLSHINISDPNAVYRYPTEISKSFESYFRYGGLPEVVQIADKRTWLSSLYQRIFFGDLITHYQIRNDYALRVLIRKLAENIKQPTSFNRLANIVSASGKKISTDTVIDYLGYLKETWMVLQVENICAKLAEKESNKKYYFSDNGILNLFLIDPFTSLLENLVAIRLRQLYGENVYFYQKGVEVDFYVIDIQLAIQVSYSLLDPDTYKREMNGLIKMAAHIEVNEMMIITKDEEKIIAIDGYSIQVIPIWKWLLPGR